MKRNCKQCGKEFEIAQSEIDFYNSKNLELPKRCEECRKSNKAKKQTNTTVAARQKKGNSGKISKICAVIVAIAAVVYGFFGNNNPVSDTTGYEPEFRSEQLLNEHYQKHGKDMGFSSAEAYEDAAGDVVENEDALHKTEAEDGDDVYYLVSTNEFVVISKDGYIRTYFCPDDGIDYYNRQ